MVTVVLWVPVIPANITKLVSAPASHMIAALVLLNHKFTLFALTVVQIALKELNFLSLALPLVHSQQALRAKLLKAFIAHHHIVHSLFYDAFALLSRAQSQVRVLRSDVELVDLFVALLNVCGEPLEEVASHVHSGRTALVGTHHFLEALDLVDGVVVQTRLTKTAPMFAVAHVDLKVFIFGFLYLTFTYFAIGLRIGNCGFYFTADSASKFGCFEVALWRFFVRFGFRDLAPQNALHHGRNSLFGVPGDAEGDGGVGLTLGHILFGLFSDDVTFCPFQIHSRLITII